MVTEKQQKNRSKAADTARNRATDIVDKALQNVSATDEAKAERREKLTTYPPLVREARDRNLRHDAGDVRRTDERKPRDE
jgi:hypothetical protein